MRFNDEDSLFDALGDDFDEEGRIEFETKFKIKVLTSAEMRRASLGQIQKQIRAVVCSSKPADSYKSGQLFALAQLMRDYDGEGVDAKMTRDSVVEHMTVLGLVLRRMDELNELNKTREDKVEFPMDMLIDVLEAGCNVHRSNNTGQRQFQYTKSETLQGFVLGYREASGRGARKGLREMERRARLAQQEGEMAMPEGSARPTVH